MNPGMQLLLSLFVLALGVAALVKGSIVMGGPDGAGPRRETRGNVARVIGGILVLSAAVLPVSLEYGFLILVVAIMASLVFGAGASA